MRPIFRILLIGILSGCGADEESTTVLFRDSFDGTSLSSSWTTSADATFTVASGLLNINDTVSGSLGFPYAYYLNEISVDEASSPGTTLHIATNSFLGGSVRRRVNRDHALLTRFFLAEHRLFQEHVRAYFDRKG
jgi:hypothetical protein